MARSLIGRLLGQPAPPPPEVAHALSELNRLAEERPNWGGLISILRDVLPLIYAEPIHAQLPNMTAEHVSAKLANRTPLLRGEPLSLDEDACARRWRRVCNALKRHPQGDAARQLAQAVNQRLLDPADLIQNVLAGRFTDVQAAAETCGCDPNLTSTLLRLTALPILAELNTGLTPLRAGIRWEQGFCPTCGSGPLLGELRGLEQILFLRCGWCAAEWEFPRLQCPFCGTRDHQVLAYLSVEGQEDQRRAAVCDHCHQYVKHIATLAALPVLDLLVADAATLHLDLAAAEQGYF